MLITGLVSITFRQLPPAEIVKLLKPQFTQIRDNNIKDRFGQLRPAVTS